MPFGHGRPNLPWPVGARGAIDGERGELRGARAGGGASEARRDQAQARARRQALDKAIEAAEIPGAVVLARMTRDGETLEYLGVRGLAVVRPERIPMARETIFDLASLTKVIATTTAMLMLVERRRGRARRSGREVPAARSASARRKRVTVRHLLTHSVGPQALARLPRAAARARAQEGRALARDAGREEWILSSIYRSALVHEPGSAAVYGDLDFIVLGALVEAVTRQPLDDVLRASACSSRSGSARPRFVPIGEGAPPLAGRDARRIAATENCPWRERIVWGEVHDPNASAMGGVAGHAGPVRAGRRRDALRRGLARRLARPQRRAAARGRAALRRAPEPARGLGLGARLGHADARAAPRRASTSRRRSIGHLGFTGTSLWIDLEREAIVVMLTNRVHLVAKRSKFGLRPIVHDLIREAFADER